MKKFVHKVQTIGNKAAQIRDAIQSVPPRVAEVQQAVTGAVAQLQQIRSEVQSTVAGLRTDSETSLIDTVREIDDAAGTLREAGYGLEGLEMEVGVPQRLIVHLVKLEDVPHATIRSLATAQEGHATTHAILTALLKAEAMADRVSLASLTYHKLTVYVGPVPTVRLCWRAPDAESAAPTVTPPLAAPQPAPGLALPATGSFLGAGSFFEPRAATVTPAANRPAEPVAPLAAAPVAPAVRPEAPAVREDPLARFKKMPDLSKLRR